MNIFPAIDLRNQKCVRLTKGDFSSEKIYNEDPIRQAEIFFENGFPAEDSPITFSFLVISSFFFT